MFANHKVCNILLLVVLEWKEDLDIYDTQQWQWSGVCLRWLAVDLDTATAPLLSRHSP